MKITDDLMVQALQGFEIEYDYPVFCSICIIDSFLSNGRNWIPAFVAISKYRTLLVVPLTISVYIDGSVDLIEYPLLRFQYCKVTKTILGNYFIKAKFNDNKKRIGKIGQFYNRSMWRFDLWKNSSLTCNSFVNL